MALAAGWAVLALLGCVPLLIDVSTAGGPRLPLLLFVFAIGTSVVALVGGMFGVTDKQSGGRADRTEFFRLLGRLGNAWRAVLIVATLTAVATFISAQFHNPAGSSVRTADGGYALGFRGDRVKVVSEAVWRMNSRAERREFVAAAIMINAWGGALCWATKLRDDEEDPL